MNKFKRILLLLLLTIGLVVANVAEAVVGDKGPIGNKGPGGTDKSQSFYIRPIRSF